MLLPFITFYYFSTIFNDHVYCLHKSEELINFKYVSGIKIKYGKN